MAASHDSSHPRGSDGPAWSRHRDVPKDSGSATQSFARPLSRRPSDRSLVAHRKESPQSQHALEHFQTEILLQSRRQDEVFECLAKLEADLSRVAKLTVENEGLQAEERHHKHVALANLTRRTEDALLTCESLRKGQDHLAQRLERLEQRALTDEEGRAAVDEAGGNPTADDLRLVQRDLAMLQDGVREKLDVLGHALRRLDSVDQLASENVKLRQEVAQLRRADERRDLEMAAVQGQIDALTKLVREQLKDPASPARGGSRTIDWHP